MNYNELSHLLESTYKPSDYVDQQLSDRGYKLDEQLSGQRAKVYLNPEGQPLVAFRGPHNMQDVGTDLAILLGLGNKTNRMKHSKEVVKQAEAKYGKPVNAVGHSMGGYLSENSGAKGNIITYNKASIGEKNRNPNQIDIRTKNDWVSAFVPRSDRKHTIKSKSINPFIEHRNVALRRNKYKTL